MGDAAVQVSRCDAGAADASRSLQPVRSPDAVTPHTAQPNERFSLWVRRNGATAVQYASLKGVDTQQTVEDVKERWANQANLEVTDLALVTLRLAKCGARKPTPAEEAAAVELDDPSLTLAEAGIIGTAWLLADMAGVCP